MDRNFHVMFADDIRVEAGDKRSIMGVYGDSLVVPKFVSKFRLSKLCIVVFIRAMRQKQIGELSIRVCKTTIADRNGDSGEVLFDHEVPKSELTRSKPKGDALIAALGSLYGRPTGDAEWTSIQMEILLREIVVDEPCRFVVRISTERGLEHVDYLTVFDKSTSDKVEQATLEILDKQKANKSTVKAKRNQTKLQP